MAVGPVVEKPGLTASRPRATATPMTEIVASPEAAAPAPTDIAPGADRRAERRRLAWLKGLFAGEGGALAGMAAAGVAGAAVAVAQAWILAGIIANAIAGAAASELWRPALLALGLIALRAGMSVVSDGLGAGAAQRIKRTIRRRALNALTQLGPAWLDHRQSGSVAATIVDQIEALDGFVSRFYPAQIMAAVVPLALLVPVFAVDPPSGWMLLAAGAATPVVMAVIGWRTGLRARAQMTALKRANGYFLDRLQGLAMLKVFGEIGRERARMTAVSDDLRRRTMGVLRLAFLSATGLELLSSVALALVAVHLAGQLLQDGGLPLAHGLFLLILVPEVFQPLRRLGIHYHDRAAAVSAAEAILELLDAADGATAEGPALTVTAPPRVSFEAVSLAYPGGRRPALDAVSFDVAPGEVVALVGGSGSGKSSLLALLLGLRRPESGTIRIDGAPLVGRALLPATAWAGQSVRILSASLRENLILARPAADDRAVEAALDACRLGDVVAGLPDGLDTQVGEGGRALSGGEARRVALARAMVRDAPLVLLDEPTANLDGESEAAVLSALRTLTEGRTVIVATHSPAVMAMADRVVRLDRGRIAETGDRSDHG